MAERPHPVDVVTDDLARTYTAGARRLEALIAPALRRGLDASRVGTDQQRRGDATLAYRQRQLQAARAVLGELERTGRRGAPIIARQAYASTLLSIDRVIAPDSDLARLGLEGRFGGIHQRQVSVIAGNLERSLEAAVARSRANVEAVFARAAALEGALPPGGLPDFARFIGRRQDDPWRRLALEVAGQGNVSLATRRQLTAELVRRLQTEGVADALTGFVDRAGRRWSLDSYSTMVMRTLTREASSRATVERLNEHGVDLVGITSHPHQHDECSEFDGNTYSRTGATPGYPILERLPPFHPRCRHVLGPAGDGSILDRFERELGVNAAEAAGKDPAAAARPAAAGPPANVGDRVRFTRAVDPSTGELVEEELEGTVAVAAADGRLMVNAGTPKRPRWLEVKPDDVKARPPAPALEDLGDVGPVLKGNAVTKALRDAQPRDLLSGRQRDAVTAYVGEGWTDAISRKLRRGRELTRRERDVADTLDGVFDSIPRTEQAVTLYRGIDGKGNRGFRDLEPGQVIDDDGFGSTSIAKSVADEFAKADGDVLVITAPRGSRLLDVNQHRKAIKGATYGTEREVLLPRGSRLVVERIEVRRTKRAGPRGEETVEGRILHARLLDAEDRAPAKAWRPIEPLSRSEQRLGAPARDVTRPPPVPVDTLPTTTPPGRGLTPTQAPRADASTAERLEAQRIAALITQDPGVEPGQREAWAKAVDRDARGDNRALNIALGPDLAKFIDRAWGKRQGLRKALLNGDATIDEVEELAVEEWHRLDHGRKVREYKAKYRTRAINCFSCGRLKSRPADVCDYCGDDPVAGVNYAGGLSHGGDYIDRVRQINREFGYDA